MKIQIAWIKNNNGYNIKCLGYQVFFLIIYYKTFAWCFLLKMITNPTFQNFLHSLQDARYKFCEPNTINFYYNQSNMKYILRHILLYFNKSSTVATQTMVVFYQLIHQQNFVGKPAICKNTKLECQNHVRNKHTISNHKVHRRTSPE